MGIEMRGISHRARETLVVTNATRLTLPLQPCEQARTRLQVQSKVSDFHRQSQKRERGTYSDFQLQAKERKPRQILELKGTPRERDQDATCETKAEKIRSRLLSHTSALDSLSTHMGRICKERAYESCQPPTGRPRTSRERFDSHPPRSFKIAGRGATLSFKTPSYPGLPVTCEKGRRSQRRRDERPTDLTKLPFLSSFSKVGHSPLNPAFLFVVSAI